MKQRKYRKCRFLLPALLLTLCLGTPVLAASQDSAAARFDAEVWELPRAGVTFTLPEEYKALSGTVIYTGGDEYSYGDGVYLTAIWYVGLPKEETYSLLDKDTLDEEESARINQALFPITYVLGIDENRTDAELEAYWEEQNWPVKNLREAGNAGDCNFYLYPYPGLEEKASEVLGDYAEEFLSLYEDQELVLENLSFSEPVDPYHMTEGTSIQFDTTDIFGEPVNAEKLFAQNRITIVNVWASWCGPCIRELPQLEQLSQEAAEKGCGVVGILYDGADETGKADAIDIMEDTGVTYTVLLPWDTMESTFFVQAFPTTFFVDSEGKLIGDPVVGAYVEKYSEVLDALLDAL